MLCERIKFSDVCLFVVCDKPFVTELSCRRRFRVRPKHEPDKLECILGEGCLFLQLFRSQGLPSKCSDRNCTLRSPPEEPPVAVRLSNLMRIDVCLSEELHSEKAAKCLKGRPSNLREMYCDTHTVEQH
jgi:hypothetical protein